MVSSLLLTWREGFEAAVIISLLLAYLKRTGHLTQMRTVLYAAAAAAIACLVVGSIVFAVSGELSGRAEELFEGFVGIGAAIVVTHVWRKSVNHRRKLEHHASAALSSERVTRGVFILAFVAVAIEGLEIVLFLLAGSDAGTGAVIAGGLAGLLLAVASGWIFYLSSRMRDAVLFFYAISAILIVIGAGLLAHGIHELQEAGVFPVLVEDIWNLNGVPLIGEDEPVGSFLKTSIGYNGNPELLEFLAWAGYLAIAAWIFDAAGFARRLFHRSAPVPVR